MRSFVRRASVLGVCLGAVVAASGCEAQRATEYVAGISTQVTVPRDLKAVRVEVNVGGFQTFCQAYKVYDGRVQLPRSLGAFPNNESALKTNLPITYTIVGLTEDYDPASTNPLYAFCAPPKIGSDGARILRRSRQPYVPDEILFLPMPLKYSCYDKQCEGDDMTCKGGKCVPALVVDPAKTFPRFTPDLVDGTGAGCFSTQLCMGAAFPAIVVDSETCTFAVANSPSAPPTADPALDPFRPPCPEAPAACPSGVCNAGRCEPLAAGTPWEGVNVEVVYDGGLSREILDQDPDEGFLVPDPAKPQQFRLAEGLCEMVKGRDASNQPTAHRITAIRASGVCRAKSIHQPLCAGDQLKAMGLEPSGETKDPAPKDCGVTELKPPISRLMVVVDNTQPHRAFFNAEELEALEFPLRDPAFDQTEVGLLFTGADDAGGGACAPTAAPDLSFAPSREARQKLVDAFLAYAADPSTLKAGNPPFDWALSSAYDLLRQEPAGADYFRRGVVVIGNRGFNTKTCGASTPAELAQAARMSSSDPIVTYVIQLAKRDPNAKLEDDKLDEPGIYELMSAGSEAPPNPDARGTKKNAKDAFQQVINSLATCVYDVDDAKAPAVDDTVAFTNPLDGQSTTIPANAACTGDNVPGVGWGYAATAPAGKKRVHLCADSCAAYRNVLASASDFALLYQKPAMAVPVFAHKAGCATK